LPDLGLDLLGLTDPTRASVDPRRQPGVSSPNFPLVIESDRSIVADRTMSWDASGCGGHAETAVASPSTTWYLAP
jgi:hypothetical protein